MPRLRQPSHILASTPPSDASFRLLLSPSDARAYVLPLRIDLTTTANGVSGRGLLETRDIQLNPDPAQFDVPAGYQKVTSQQLKEQVQSFIAFVRAFAPYVGQQLATPPPPAATNANRAATNANANRP